MNAYELADRLENELNLSENLFVFDAANMLRQQADEIQGLKDGFNTAWGGTNNSELAEVRALANRKILEVKAQADYIKHLEEGLEASIAMNKAQADRIAELENQLEKCSHHEAMAHQGGYEIGYAEGLKKASEK